MYNRHNSSTKILALSKAIRLNQNLMCTLCGSYILRHTFCWNWPSDTYLETAVWRPPPHGKKNLRLTAACIRLSRGVLNARLIPIWKQLSHGRLHTATSRYIEQPPHGRLQTATWRIKKHLSRNSCLTSFSKQLSCGEFQQKLSGGWHDSDYVDLIQLFVLMQFPFLHSAGFRLPMVCISPDRIFPAATHNHHPGRFTLETEEKAVSTFDRYYLKILPF